MSAANGVPEAWVLTANASLSKRNIAPSQLDNMSVNVKKSTISRRVWRMTADSPLGAFVDFDPTVKQPASGLGEPPAKVLEPAPVSDWRASSFDLLSGVEVFDHTDTIPGALFDRLFKR